MIKLSGNNLGKRHHELNKKVNEAADKDVDFKEIEALEEHSDIDKLYKIQLAIKYKNIDYILDVLKSGDTFYISRALQCDWLSDDEYENVINPEYLHDNVFPHMSDRMKKKLVASLLLTLRNEARTEQFHHYCMRNRMEKYGIKFLYYTSESFKMDILNLHPHVYNNFHNNRKYLERFIGDSLELAERYLKLIDGWKQIEVLYKLHKTLYNVSPDRYLDLLESLECIDQRDFRFTTLRFSREIMKKHKKRVLKRPLLYLNILHRDVVVKYSTGCDAKVYMRALMPHSSYEFWGYYNRYTQYFDLIPLGERYSFIKKIFQEKYPDEPFEECYEFYDLLVYKIMTRSEQEDWALNQIASEKQIHGIGNDYIWYKFINFRKAFHECKKLIKVANDNDKRNNILRILVESAKNQDELRELLEFYYEKHKNEISTYGREFIDKLIENHNILELNEECWKALEKIFHSMDVFYKLCERDYNKTYRILAFIYLVIHEKSVPEVFNDFILMFTITCYDVIYANHFKDVDAKKRGLVFQYMLRVYTEQVEALSKDRKKDLNHMEVFITSILDLIVEFKKTRDSIPKTIETLIMANFTRFKYHRIYRDLKKPVHKFDLKDIKRFIRRDVSLVISEFPTIKKFLEERGRKINFKWVIRKLQIYFSHDIAPKCRDLFKDCLSVEELYLHVAKIGVLAILNLSEEQFKIDFLKKYVPENAQIDHETICRNHLNIQTAICSEACNTRPLLPLANIRDYIVGDYVKFCVPLFDSYTANLKPSQCVDFVEALLNTPVSIQKHVLRLAFKCFNTQNLKNLVLKTWKSTKNVSIREVLYIGLHDKINYYFDKPTLQWELFGALTIMTNDLTEDDEGIFNTLTKCLPPNLIGQHLYSVYTILKSFPTRTVGYQQLTFIVQEIENNLDSMSDNFLLAIMEAHIGISLEQHLNDEDCGLVYRKWKLIQTYIIKRVSFHILNLIMNKCLDKWYEKYRGEYIYRKFWIDFVNELEELSYSESTEKYCELNEIFTAILNAMDNRIPSKEIYILKWELRANCLTRKVLGENVSYFENLGSENEDMVTILKKETIIKFSEEIAKLVNDSIENGEYVSVSILNDCIQNVITSKVSNVQDSVVSNCDNNDDVLVLLCSVMSEYDNKEMYMLLMNFIPVDYEGDYKKEYLDIINKLKSFDDRDVEYSLCYKFYSSNYQYRDFMP